MDEKQLTTRLFDLVANRYDNPSQRFFALCADKLVALAKIKRGQKVLDVATGTGMVAIAAAQAVGPEGRVQAIDLSEHMITQAHKNMQRAGFNNTDFHIMDGEQLEFKSRYFDVVLCSFGLFFMPDMQAALQNWYRVLKPGGKIIFTSFAETAFQPLSDIYLAQMKEYGIEPPSLRWLLLKSEQTCQEMLQEAGFTQAQTQSAQMGYHLTNSMDWWEIIQSSGFRGLYERLNSKQQTEFQQKHLAALEPHQTEQGLWLDVQTIYSSAIRPSE